MMAGGAMTGSGRLGRAGFNRFTQPQQMPSVGAPARPMGKFPTPGLDSLAPQQVPFSSGGGSPVPMFRMPSARMSDDPMMMQ